MLVAVMPSPGLLYIVAGRLLAEVKGSHRGLAWVPDGLSTFRRAVGLCALLVASAQAFAFLKNVGGLYLIWFGIKAWREARIVDPIEVQTTDTHSAFRSTQVIILPRARKEQCSRKGERCRQRSPAGS